MSLFSVKVSSQLRPRERSRKSYTFFLIKCGDQERSEAAPTVAQAGQAPVGSVEPDSLERSPASALPI